MPDGPMIREAVILAAGLGTRLRDHVADRPKGLLVIGDRPILAESIDRLSAAGIDSITLVIGHLADQYREFASTYRGRVRTVYNPRFAETGSMYSLYVARERVSGPFLLLESDLVYEQRALQVLLESPDEDAILLSGPTGAGDEVWVEADPDGNLRSMSKDRSALAAVSGELVGISRLSPELYRLMNRIAAGAFAEQPGFAYETDCMVRAATGRSIRCITVPDLLWGEIDDAAHLERVRGRVHPEILARDNP